MVRGKGDYGADRDATIDVKVTSRGTDLCRGWGSRCRGGLKGCISIVITARGRGSGYAAIRPERVPGLPSRFEEGSWNPIGVRMPEAIDTEVEVEERTCNGDKKSDSNALEGLT